MGVFRLVVFASALILSGAPTVLMQLGAWGLMIGQRGDREAVVDIVKDAFLGTEPCQRCQIITDGASKTQGGERDYWELTSVRLLDLRSETVTLPARGRERLISIFSREALFRVGRSDSPPTPPPRDFFVS